MKPKNSSLPYRYDFWSFAKRKFNNQRYFVFLILELSAAVLGTLALSTYAYYNNIYKKISEILSISEIMHLTISVVFVSLLIFIIISRFSRGVKADLNSVYFPHMHIHSTIHEARDIITAMRINYQSVEKNPSKFGINEIEIENDRRFFYLLTSISNRLKDIMDTIHTRYDVAVSIKIANKSLPYNSEDYIEKTIYNTVARSERGDQEYKTRRANFGIQTVVNLMRGSHAFYVCNNIAQHNKSVSGPHQFFGGKSREVYPYNNIMVVPIRFSAPNMRSKSAIFDEDIRELSPIVLGYIKIDSKKTQFTEIDRQIISTFSDLMYIITAARFHMQIQHTEDGWLDLSSDEAWHIYLKNWFTNT